MGCGLSKGLRRERRTTSRISVTPANFVPSHVGGLPSEYEILSTIGKGAFAEVKLCLHTPTGQQRAVKIIDKRGLSHRQLDQNLFLVEVNALKSLTHPNILRCFEIYQDSTYFYVVTEFCEGGELFQQILKRKRLNENEVAHIIQQVLYAINFCHEKNIIHRDLKPENILLDDKNDVLSIKVADFGSSVIIDPQKRLSGCFGSAYYVAPEVVMGYYNEKCDIWSCGVIMYVLLTGNPPYPGNNKQHILNMVKTNPLKIEPHRMPSLSPEAISMLKELLRVDFNKRVSAREALGHPWFQNYIHNTTPADLTPNLGSLKEYDAASHLKDAVHVYLASQIISQADLKNLKNNFVSIDANSDGKLNKEELVKQYTTTMSAKEATNTVENIMNNVDRDKSGDIDYSEFLKSCMDHNKYMSEENLRKAFDVFDTDRSGNIDIEELKDVLTGNQTIEDEFWNKVLREADKNQDGVIEFNEFIQMMRSKNL